MLLCNLTSNEKGQEKYLHLNDEKIEGVVFMKMVDKYFDNIYDVNYNFFSNILANITANKAGRVLVLEYQIYKIILVHFDKLNTFKMVNMLRVFRNCCFEFETFENQLLINEVKNNY